VITRGDRRTLEFRHGMVQSEMRLSRPDALVLRYNRAMMAFALFQPAPRHILMVGLGGGSLVKFCYRHFPQARITVLELRTDVIALRSQFMIPPDDRRLRIIHADAAEYLARRQENNDVDVLMVDGFDEHGLPPALGSAAFYASCRRALRPDGVLVANIFSYDAAYAAMLARLRHAFAQRLCWLDGVAGNNRIIFALKPGADAQARAPRMQRLLRRRSALGLYFLNRILVRWLVWRLQRPERPG
jgi:spermidine synthase